MDARPRHVVVGTAGHIDHGKSALVRALTGTDPDRLPEEKERGITIDLGFAHASWDGITFSFVDVPGHERLVRTMVAGATGFDIALLVVASDDGPMPQTREHLAILRLLGLRTGVIARTKADVSDEETGLVVEEEMRELVRGSFLDGAPILAVSALSGRGLDELRAALTHAAYTVSPRDPSRAPARLWIDRVFTMKGFGPVVTGTLDSGRLGVEDRLSLLPGELEVRVRRIEVHGEERDEAFAGERTSLNLAGIDRADLARGQALVAKDTLEPATLLTVQVEVLGSLAEPLVDGLAVRFQAGTADVEGRLHSLPVEGGEPLLSPGARCLAQLSTLTPVAVRRGDRFVLRRPSPPETLGGGLILDTRWPRVRRRAPLPVRAARILAEGEELEVARLFLERSGLEGLAVSSLAARLGVFPPVAAAYLERLGSEGGALRLSGSHWAPSAAAVEMAGRAASIFAARRRAGAPTLLLPRKELLERLGRGLPAATAEGWLVTLGAAGKVALAGDQAGPPGSSARGLSEETGGFADQIAAAYQKAAFDSPRHMDLARALGTKPAVVEGLIGHLLKSGVLVRLSPDVVVHREAVETAIRKLDSRKGETLGVAAFRDLFGLTRKTLIPLLEHLDRLRRTRRVGDARVVE